MRLVLVSERQGMLQSHVSATGYILSDRGMLNQFAQTWCLFLYSSVLDRTHRLVTHITDHDSIKKYKLDRWQPDWSRFHGIFDLEG